MFKNQSGTSNLSMDMYPTLTENNAERIISLISSLTFSIISVPFLYGIIMFERFGSDKKRSVINIFTSMICWTFIGLSIIVKIPETFRYIFGPLPGTFCCIQNVNKYYIGPTVMFFYDAIAVARYVYIFCLNNPAAFNDEFWGCFVSIWIFFFTLLLTITIFFLAECKNFGYFICNGKISNQQLETFTSRGMNIILTTSIIIHLVTRVRILVYKRKDNKVHPQSQRMTNKTTALKQIETRSVSSFCANLAVVFISLLVIALISKLNQTPMEDLNKYPNYVLVYFAYLVSTNVLILLFIAASYRKEALRKYVMNEMKDLFYLQK